MHKSVRFELLIGVNPGYDHDNENPDPIAEASEVWHAAAEACLAAGGMYVAGSVTYCKMVYREQWGCPPGGEDAVMISGIMNTHYFRDANAYIESVRTIAMDVKARLKQVTAILSFYPADCEFLQ